MLTLVTGANGFIGRHMIAELKAHGHQVIATDISNVSGLSKLDVTQGDSVRQFVWDAKPDFVIHLAGMATTQVDASKASQLYQVNVGGVANICAAMQNLSTRQECGVIVVSSAYVHGGDKSAGSHMVNEETSLVPRNRYGASKLAAEMTARIFETDQLKIYRVRPFNHIGPGQELSFVAPDLATRIANCPQGRSIETGNLSSKRDFTDVRDIVRGYRLIMERQPTPRCFTFGSGVGRPIQSIFDTLRHLSGKSIDAHTNPALLRNNDAAELLADSALALNVLGWKPQIPIETSLKDLWNDIIAK